MMLSILIGAAASAQASLESTAALDEMVAKARRSGALASVAVAIVRGDETVYAKAVGSADIAAGRPATTSTLYRIASLSKPLTASLLVALRDAGRLRLDDPLANHLPAGVQLPTDPRGAAGITLRHLAQHVSGLPERPINVPRGEQYFWGEYDEVRLYESLARTPLAAPIGDQVLYSNLGVGLLGHALARLEGESYGALLERVILEPLGMKDTAVATAAALGDRLATGYGEAGKPVEQWELGCLAACGGVASNVLDMARFLSWQFRAGSPDAGPLRGGSLSELHRPQRVLDGWRGAVGLGWFVDYTDDLGEVVRHNGGMAGYQAHMSFSPVGRVGVVVLANGSPGSAGHVAQQLGADLLRAGITEFGLPSPSVKSFVRSLATQFRDEPGDELEAMFASGFLERIPTCDSRQCGRCSKTRRARGASTHCASEPWHSVGQSNVST